MALKDQPSRTCIAPRFSSDGFRANAYSLPAVAQRCGHPASGPWIEEPSGAVTSSGNRMNTTAILASRHPRAHHHQKIFISPLLATLYENPPGIFHTHASYSDIERAGALACRTPCYRSSPGSPAATLGDGQRHVFGSDLAEWPAIGLSNTVCMGAS